MSFFNRHKNGHHHDHHDQRHDQHQQDTHQSYPPSSYPPAPSSYPPAPFPYQSAPSPYPPVPAPYGQPLAPNPPAPAPYGQPHAPYAAPVSAAQPPYGGAPSQQHTVRVFTKAEENYSLTVRDGTVILAPANPRDEYQHWYKDFRWSTKVKDEEGLPAFALINKPTGLAIKHSLGPTHPVRLIPYNPEYMDESVLWTESHDTGEGFRCIRMVNNIRLNFDAFHGDKDHGGVHDGTTIVLWEWVKGKNQRWKLVPY